MLRLLLFHFMRQQRNRRIPSVSNFNPYNEWLGISATNPTYYQLLGVSLRETNAETIRSLAKQQIRKLKAADIGHRKKARDKLELRIRRAAQCLCDPTARAAYDQRIQNAISHDRSQQGKALAIKAPVPARSKKKFDAKPDAKSASKKKAGAKPDESIRKLDHGNSDLTVDIESPVIPQVGTNVRGIARQLQKRRKRSNIAKFCAAMILLSIAGLAFLFAQQTGMLGRSGNLFSASNSAQQTSPLAAETVGGNDDEPSHDVATGKSGSVNLSNANPARPSNAKRPTTTNRPGETIVSATQPTSAPISSQATSSPTINLTSQSIVPPTPDELQQLGELLTKAKSALSNRDIALAKRLLSEAEPLARRQQDQAKFSRLTTLTKYVEEYWAAANDRLKSLRGGSEVTIGKTPVMVVERTDQRLMLRVNGENKTYQTADLPLELAMALADGWLNNSAASTKVIRGAMMAVSTKFNDQAVRRLWREAEATGDVELGDLEEVLDDEYELR